MSTGLIIAIIVVAIVLLIGLWFAVTRMGQRRRELQRERQLQERRQTAAAEHARQAEANTRNADVAERRARIAQAEAERERAEATLHRERAELHEQGLADHELADGGEGTREGAVAGEPGDGVVTADEADRTAGDGRVDRATTEGTPAGDGVDESTNRAGNGAVASESDAPVSRRG